MLVDPTVRLQAVLERVMDDLGHQRLVFNTQQPTLVADDDGNALLPSIVHSLISDEGEELSFGRLSVAQIFSVQVRTPAWQQLEEIHSRVAAASVGESMEVDVTASGRDTTIGAVPFYWRTLTITVDRVGGTLTQDEIERLTWGGQQLRYGEQGVTY